MSLLAGTAVAGDALRLATTTSTESSGLLEVLLPAFERQAGLDVHVIAVGSGKAMKLAENGDADVVLSHAPDLERRFVADGFGVSPREVMYNDFVIVGPPADPAAMRGAAGATEALRRAASAQATFVSRADDSGTHHKERELWSAARIRPAGPWYLEAGLGMGEVLLLASERRAYTLTDRATFIAFRNKVELSVLVEGDPALYNRYTVIAVNPARHPHVRNREAMMLIRFLTGPEGQSLIRSYRLDGEQLFHPLAISGKE